MGGCMIWQRGRRETEAELRAKLVRQNFLQRTAELVAPYPIRIPYRPVAMLR